MSLVSGGLTPAAEIKFAHQWWAAGGAMQSQVELRWTAMRSLQGLAAGWSHTIIAGFRPGGGGHAITTGVAADGYAIVIGFQWRVADMRSS